MTDSVREGQRLPRNDAPRGIERWARHGVEELAERDAQERAELGEQDAPPQRHADIGTADGVADSD